MPEPKEISVNELFALGASFSVESLIEQIATQDDEKDNVGHVIGADFFINKGDKQFVVRKEKIREYFTEHPKPVPKMTLKEEVEYLRKRVGDLESEKGKPIPEPEKLETREEPVIPGPTEPKKVDPLEIQKQLAKELKEKGVKPTVGRPKKVKPEAPTI